MASIIIFTYFVLIVDLWFSLLVFGMSIFDAIAHSMTTIATGGFSTHNDSIGFFKSPNIEIVASVFILLGSIPFYLHLKFIKGNKKFLLTMNRLKD